MRAALFAALLAALFLASPLAQAAAPPKLPVRVVVKDCVESFTDMWKDCQASIDNCQYLDNCVGAWVEETGKVMYCIAGVCTPWLPYCITVTATVAKLGVTQGGCPPPLSGDSGELFMPAQTDFHFGVQDSGHVLPPKLPAGTVAYLADLSVPDDWTPNPQ